MGAASLMRVCPGVTAIAGSGGKTTLMFTLAEELRGEGRVLVCTTTRIYRPEGMPVYGGADGKELRALLDRYGVVCAGRAAEGGKLSTPGLPFADLAELADYVLTEADGARGLPLKAHAVWEPVIPENAAQTVLVVGVDGLGQRIRDVCHRPKLYAERAGIPETAVVTPEAAARVLTVEGIGDRIFLNKTETGREQAERLAELLPRPVCGGSLYRREWICWS